MSDAALEKSNETSVSSVHRDGDFVVIKIHEKRINSVCVALTACKCVTPKSKSTERVREALRGALKATLARKEWR